MSVAALLALAGVLYAGLALPRLNWATARWFAGGLAVLVGLKLVASITAPPLGLEASYWVGAPDAGPPEKSTDFPGLSGATRIDPRLDLHGEDFAVHFFNDASRFNFGADVQPGRDQLPFSVRWKGWLLVPSDGQRRFVLEADGPAALRLDDTPLSADQTLTLAAGSHPLRVDYSRPEARVPSLRLTWQRVPGAPLEVLGAPDVRWQASDASATLSAGLGTAFDVGLIALVVAWIALAVARAIADRRYGVATLARAALWLVPLVFLTYGALIEAPGAGRATILSGLDDWLVYESSARDILLNGLLMDGGQGHAPPFYGQPLYLYVLALAHRLTGESLIGPIVLQFTALGGVAVGAAVLARRAFGTRLDGLVALAAFLALLQLEPEHFKIARQLFNENLYMPLVMASLIVLVSLARRAQAPPWWQALLAGGLLGLTAISRSQFLLCVPFGLLVLFLAWRRARADAAIKTTLVLIGIALTIAPVTARNWIVSGQLVPISSSAGASLLEFHRPPTGLLDQSLLDRDPLYNALHLDQQTRTVVAFARADPRGYLATLLPLGAHSIGLQGRNDPGIYWPLLTTFVLYLVSLGFRRTRRLHVWPIHAFVASHLLVLMLFEADTYGYRLVMPMYAPMVAVAAQVPLAAIRALVRSPAAGFMRGNRPGRAARFAVAGWTAIILAALVWQAKGLVELWPEREPALHGLGGAAAHAALTSDRVGAAVIYVASVDGTPRRFGAGSLPGLRYPWFKWFDPLRSLPLPPSSTTAVYMLSELGGHDLPGDLTTCLGQPSGDGELVVSGSLVRQQCVDGMLAGGAEGVTFDGLARVHAVHVPEQAAAGDTLESRVLWQPVVAHPEPQQVSLHLDDPMAGDGTLWGNGTLEVYPAREWQPDETVLSRIPVATDATAIPQAYRLTLGIGPLRPNGAPATANWHGSRTDRVPVAAVTLSPGSSPPGQALPADMRPVEGPPLIGGGLELIGARPLPQQAAIGSSLRVGLLWRALQDQPAATQFKVRLVRGSGEVVQESVLSLLGGRLAPSALRAGNVVRDEQSVLISSRAPSEALTLELLASSSDTPATPVQLGHITLTGRAHTFEATPPDAEASFGEAIQLLSDQVDSAGDKVTVKLRWRSAAELQQAYKVFVHVLDASGQQVVAQRDAEPQDGRAPTTGWVVGEVIDDQYVITLPAGVASGAYPVEVGVYEPRSGDRLRLPNGDNHFVLNTRLQIH